MLIFCLYLRVKIYKTNTKTQHSERLKSKIIFNSDFSKPFMLKINISFII